MKIGDPVALRSAAKALTPVAVLLGLGAVASGAEGAGFAAGAFLALSVALHALYAGAAAAQRAMPAFAWRAIAALALIAGAAALCAPDWPYAPVLREGAAAGLIAAATGLGFSALAARAPTLRDEDW